jgi:hypothetical protein
VNEFITHLEEGENPNARRTKGRHWLQACVIVGALRLAQTPWGRVLVAVACLLLAHWALRRFWVMYAPTGWKAHKGHRRPADEIEERALAALKQAKGHVAMGVLRHAGYSVEQRGEFLRHVADVEDEAAVAEMAGDDYAVPRALSLTDYRTEGF